ncbi:hypothetical protein GCM10027091_03970 [Streptomyces daliensis]
MPKPPVPPSRAEGALPWRCAPGGRAPSDGRGADTVLRAACAGEPRRTPEFLRQEGRNGQLIREEARARAVRIHEGAYADFMACALAIGRGARDGGRRSTRASRVDGPGPRALGPPVPRLPRLPRPDGNREHPPPVRFPGGAAIVARVGGKHPPPGTC